VEGPLERRQSATAWQVGPKQSRMQLEDRSCWTSCVRDDRGLVTVKPPNGFGMVLLDSCYRLFMGWLLCGGSSFTIL
jgi:hypothetical protein